MNAMNQELTDEQVKDVMSLAQKIEKVATRLNLSMRNHASPLAGKQSQFPTGYVSVRSIAKPVFEGTTAAQSK